MRGGIAWVANHVVGGRYRLLHPIAPRVWLGLDDSTPVAIKHSRGGDDGSRLIYEANALQAAASRHVVAVVDASHVADEGEPFLVLEYLSGGTVRDFLRKNEPVEPDEVLRIVRGAALGLTKIHDAGFVHGDVKSANIVASSATIIDLDLVSPRAPTNSDEEKRASSETRRRAGGGTPGYQSPEQLVTATQRVSDLRADLWGLAVVIFECLVGVLPFKDAEVPQGRSHRPLPEHLALLQPFFARAFSREPDQRFQSAAELAESFELFVKRLPRSAGATTPEHPSSDRDTLAPVHRSPPPPPAWSVAPTASGGGSPTMRTDTSAIQPTEAPLALPMRRSKSVAALMVGMVALLGVAAIALPGALSTPKHVTHTTQTPRRAEPTSSAREEASARRLPREASTTPSAPPPPVRIEALRRPAGSGATAIPAVSTRPATPFLDIGPRPKATNAVPPAKPAIRSAPLVEQALLVSAPETVNRSEPSAEEISKVRASVDRAVTAFDASANHMSNEPDLVRRDFKEHFKRIASRDLRYFVAAVHEALAKGDLATAHRLAGVVQHIADKGVILLR